MSKLVSSSNLYIALILFTLINLAGGYQIAQITHTRNKTPTIPLSQPNMNQAAIAVWANTALIDLYTYNYGTINQRLSTLSNYFTPTEWQKYLHSMHSSGVITDVQNRKLVVSAIATAPASIKQQQVANQHYQWTIDIPILVTYSNPSKPTQTSYLDVQMTITRQAEFIGKDGIAITGFTASPTQPPPQLAPTQATTPTPATPATTPTPATPATTTTPATPAIQ